MDKEIEETLKCLEKLGDRAYKRYFFTEESLEELKTPIKQALLELKSIKEANPSKAIQCFKRLSEEYNLYDVLEGEYFETTKESQVIWNALLKAQEQKKVLDIIVAKKVDMYRLAVADNVASYNKWTEFDEYWLTEEEFNLIKEML